MPMETWFGLSLATFILVATPGPSSLAVLATSAQNGLRAAFSLIAGILFADIMYLCLALMSLGMLTAHLAPVMDWVKLAGACCIIYLGYKKFTALPACVLFSIFAALSAAALLGRYISTLLERPKFARIMNKITGGVLIGVGVSVARS